jgi:hypothetical protein
MLINLISTFPRFTDDGRAGEEVEGKVREVAHEEEHVERNEGPFDSHPLVCPAESLSQHRISTCIQERKYFDSGDYAMQKAGVAAPDSVGSVGAGQGLRGMEGLERATPER